MKLSIEELSVIYRDGDYALQALDQVALTLEPGRITALVGESGSGKTTLAKTLMGLLPDNAEISGSVKLNETELIGLDEAGFNEIRWSRVAMVFQNGAANLNPAHRIIDQVAEPLIHHGRSEKQAANDRADERSCADGTAAGTGTSFPP